MCACVCVCVCAPTQTRCFGGGTGCGDSNAILGRRLDANVVAIADKGVLNPQRASSLVRVLSSKMYVNPCQDACVRAHYAAPNRAMTTQDLAQAVSYKSYHAANSWYGRLGRVLAAELGFTKVGSNQYWTDILASWAVTPDGALLTMHPGLAEALEALGLAGNA